MKGIILAGGRGSRLYPVTTAVCKQLLPVYDKPMIYYPLSVLMQSGIRDILLISTPEDMPRFQALFGNGSHLGLTLSYAAQPRPEGIAQAFLIAESFIGDNSVALILGDNIFYGHHLSTLLAPCRHLEEGALVFGYEVKDPQRYGVVEFDEDHNVRSIVEKPLRPLSPYAVTGLYFYDNTVVERSKALTPSKRGELEITDINVSYLSQGKLRVQLLERGFAWLDTGTHDALHKASAYVHTIQERQGIQIACLEEIAYTMGFISREELVALSEGAPHNEYGGYLKALVGQKFSRDFAVR